MSKSSFAKLLNQDVTIRRKTDVLRSAVGITASMSLDTQPSEAVKLFATISGGTTGSGTLTINGTVGGVADSENLVFSSNGFKESSKKFTEVTSITEAGFTNEAAVPTLEIKAKSGAGQPIFQEVLQFGRKARITGISSGRIGKYTIKEPGRIIDASHKCFMSYDDSQLVNEKDILVDHRGTRYEVLPFDIVDDRFLNHHLELPLKRII
jgi:hypothetical protein